MDALDSVLAVLVDADRDCAYATIKREPLETLIYEWARRGDQMTLLSGLLIRARNQLAEGQHSHSSNASCESTLRDLDSAITESAPALARHRHAVRRELATRLSRFCVRQSPMLARTPLTHCLRATESWPNGLSQSVRRCGLS